jgi:hypothetical protein
MDAEAEKQWEDLYANRLWHELPGLSGEVVCRGATIVLRVALIYALLDSLAANVTRGEVTYGFRGAVVLSPAHLNAAVAVWNYAEASALQLFQGRCGSGLENRILHLLRAHGPRTTTEFHRHLGRTGRAGLAEALRRLKDAGLIRSVVVTHAGAGRPGERWELATPCN